MKYPLVVFAVWRIIHAVIVIVMGGGIVDATFRFDSAFYTEVTRYGYVVTDHTYKTFQDTAFFPLLAWITSVFDVVLPFKAAAVLVSNSLAAGAFVAVYAACNEWLGQRVARKSVIILALWPTSYFLWAFYSESALVLTTAAAMYFTFRRRYVVAAIFIGLAGLSRPVGLVLGPCLAVGRFLGRRRLDREMVFQCAASFVAFGLLVTVQQLQVGDGLAFAHAQRAWGRTLDFPWVALGSAFHGIFAKFPGFAGELTMDVVAVFLVAALVAWCCRQTLQRKWRAEPVLWAFAALAVPLMTNQVSSQARFALGTWPVFAALGVLSDRIPRWLRAAFAVGAVWLGVILLHRWLRAEFVA